MKKQNVIYWVGVALTVLWFGSSGFFEVTKNPIVWDKTIALGYPEYFIITLGIAKLLGILVLVLPNKAPLLWVKEWVFAGLFFDIIFALVSGCVVNGAIEFIAPTVAFAIVFMTYLSFRRVAAI